MDLSNLEVLIPKEGGANEAVKTCPAAMGFAFAAGTTDGPGAFDFKQGDDKVFELIELAFQFFRYIFAWSRIVNLAGNTIFMVLNVRETSSGD